MGGRPGMSGPSYVGAYPTPNEEFAKAYIGSW